MCLLALPRTFTNLIRSINSFPVLFIPQWENCVLWKKRIETICRYIIFWGLNETIGRYIIFRTEWRFVSQHWLWWNQFAETLLYSRDNVAMAFSLQSCLLSFHRKSLFFAKKDRFATLSPTVLSFLCLNTKPKYFFLFLHSHLIRSVRGLFILYLHLWDHISHHLGHTVTI